MCECEPTTGVVTVDYNIGRVAQPLRAVCIMLWRRLMAQEMHDPKP